MDRYKIAIGKRLQAYRFPPTQSVERTSRYIDYCVKNKVCFMADNIPSFILESALIQVSKTTNVPIIVKTPERALILSAAHSHKNIHSMDERLHIIDKIDFNFPYLIYYDCPIIEGFKTYLKVSTRTA